MAIYGIRLSERNDSSISKDDINNGTSGVNSESMNLSRIPGRLNLLQEVFMYSSLWTPTGT